ncbi:MAG TPA: L-aspartate oxidase [Leclercia adecarboxylata]|nr:L-aspartate oxidase [Leclercia sp. LSNIH3]POW70199.1 L-aspartate oxidase [Leclercia sp. LSNIH4]QBF86661.1 L-aspartate oxidase [Leclercia adecarboxylata]QFH52301.1 L-aspartate oxidase [Leclercia adecarboxylata]QFH66238.1 L-aspartate oxidase [Leclercia adecarboxylata]
MLLACCLVIATNLKKNVRFLAFGCYAGQTLFSKLNTHHERND